jgi:predicted lipid-binding transport protein (Tim44 family)
MTPRWLAGTLALALMATLVPDISEARRLGGGRAIGMQRQAPPPRAPQNTPPQPATPGQTAPTAGVPAAAGATGAAAAAGKRSWMGPIAGLAAGLGLAALASHLGFGEGLANFMILALLAMVAVFVIRMLMSRLAGNRPREAMAGASSVASTGPAGSANAPLAQPERPAPAQRSMTGVSTDNVSVTGVPLAPLASTASAVEPIVSDTAPAMKLPEGFDLPAFERVAKMIFIRLQAANDKADLDDLREFTTPEMFAAVRLDLQDRNGVAQHTDVDRIDAQLIDFDQEPTRLVASVHFKGLVREEAGATPVPFDEVWHLVKPTEGNRSWAIAGIQQPQ